MKQSFHQFSVLAQIFDLKTEERKEVFWRSWAFWFNAIYRVGFIGCSIRVLPTTLRRIANFETFNSHWEYVPYGFYLLIYLAPYPARWLSRWNHRISVGAIYIMASLWWIVEELDRYHVSPYRSLVTLDIESRWQWLALLFELGPMVILITNIFKNQIRTGTVLFGYGFMALFVAACAFHQRPLEYAATARLKTTPLNRDLMNGPYNEILGAISFFVSHQALRTVELDEIRNTDLIDLTVFLHDPQQAQERANAYAEIARVHLNKGGHYHAEIVYGAQFPRWPAAPKMGLIALYAALGFAVVGGVATSMSSHYENRRSSQHPQSIPLI